ncbi:MAG: CoA pyrophosphatase [Syntrophales bacterium]|jgi:8-oxo-dGTP pyrophosphatase MutT (NUDIX family)|nr:CoA pyrophosphatase [Syntrophales bacterium]MCK9528569.1 CoA pyrophosphatase [Syntrophales bacterium]MDX9922795.1 CoA pyrophosphatase [Syntrophales bacterium]
MNVPTDKRDLLDLAGKRLASEPVDYARRMSAIRSENRKGVPWQPAGVLIPLCFKNTARPGTPAREEFVVQLIRRSSAVAQAGDLSGPGGMLNPRLDGILRIPLLLGMTPVLRGFPRNSAKTRGSEEFAAIGLFLANALREAWEEIRLNPLNVEFLGPLPFRNLILFTKTIFPVLGYVKKDAPFRLNEEVDRVVEIPLSAFFREEHYGTYCINDNVNGSKSFFETPCLIWTSPDGEEDVLWGVTLQIVMDFLAIVLDFKPPGMGGSRLVTRTLSQAYLRGNGRREAGRPGHSR